MSALSARSPRMSFSAPTMIDLPEPVSPVTAVKPGASDQVSSSTSARLRMRSEESVASTARLWKPPAELFNPRTCRRPACQSFSSPFSAPGTSQGVPVIGCDCAVCRSPDPRDQRMRSSLYLQTPECAWVVDTGPDFRSQCLRHGVRQVDAVVYTHAHTDHIMGFDDLRPFCPGGAPLPIYGSADTIANLRRVFEFAFNGENRFPGYMHPVPHIVSGPFPLGGLELVPLPVPHGRAVVFGYLFKRDGAPLVAYLSDCKAVPEAVGEADRGRAAPDRRCAAAAAAPHAYECGRGAGRGRAGAAGADVVHAFLPRPGPRRAGARHCRRRCAWRMTGCRSRSELSTPGLAMLLSRIEPPPESPC